jgi:hypothetical protein
VRLSWVVDQRRLAVTSASPNNRAKGYFSGDATNMSRGRRKEPEKSYEMGIASYTWVQVYRCRHDD